MVLLTECILHLVHLANFKLLACVVVHFSIKKSLFVHQSTTYIYASKRLLFGIFCYYKKYYLIVKFFKIMYVSLKKLDRVCSILNSDYSGTIYLVTLCFFTLCTSLSLYFLSHAINHYHPSC